MACTQCQTCISLKSTTKHEQGSYTKCSQEKGSFFTSEITSVTQCTYYFLWNDVSVIKFTAVIFFLTKFQYLSTALILEGYNNLRSFTGDHEFQTVPCNHGYSLSHVLLSHNLRGEKQPDVTLSSCTIYTFVIISCVCLMPRVCCYCSSIQKKN